MRTVASIFSYLDYGFKSKKDGPRRPLKGALGEDVFTRSSLISLETPNNRCNLERKGVLFIQAKGIRMIFGIGYINQSL